MTTITPDQHKIIDAALKRFRKFGHENTTMAQIAKDLGYSRTFLYYYFPDKESIFKLALIRSADNYFASIENELKKKITGIKMFENAIRTKISCSIDFHILGVYTDDTLYKMLLTDPELQHIVTDEQKLLSKIILKGKKDGTIVKCDPDKTVWYIRDALNGYTSFSLRRMSVLGKVAKKDIDSLFKRQLEFGLMLVQAIKA